MVKNDKLGVGNLICVKKSARSRYISSFQYCVVENMGNFGFKIVGYTEDRPKDHDCRQMVPNYNVFSEILIEDCDVYCPTSKMPQSECFILFCDCRKDRRDI